ncbi:hypothetical protein MRB53_040176 [Persea americana]|nr:hypothetical protein MRB53_040176 [Persea americana]
MLSLFLLLSNVTAFLFRPAANGQRSKLRNNQPSKRLRLASRIGIGPNMRHCCMFVMLLSLICGDDDDIERDCRAAMINQQCRAALTQLQMTTARLAVAKDEYVTSWCQRLHARGHIMLKRWKQTMAYDELV